LISRGLLNLAARGYQFPRQDALRIDRQYRPATYPAVQIRALCRFYAAGRLLEPGDVATVPLPDAIDAEALHRAQRL